MKAQSDNDIIPRWEWEDAEIRLDLMEGRARELLRRGAIAARIVVAVERMTAPPRVDLWHPGQGSGLIVGPDGKPLGSPSA